MNPLFEKLMARVGSSKIPFGLRAVVGFRSIVQYTNDFKRIESLPRREWDTEPLALDRARVLTDALKTPTGSMVLWKVQAAALAEIMLYRGLFAPVGVGQGKALMSLLAPVVLEAKRPVLLVPAQLRDQTKTYVIPEMRKHWRLHEGLQVIGYEELSLEKNKDLLEQLNPDLIILDECHRVKSPAAGRTKRLMRWFRAHPETKCIAMSGTISNRSIRDFAHIARWALKGSTPLPDRWVEIQTWADAIDVEVEEGQRADPGALRRFCKADENARQGFRRRLTETPGVVATSENLLGTALRITRWPITAPPVVLEALVTLRKNWETPNGDPIAEAVDLWRHARELALGFWYRWDPPAPREWMKARREWKSYVREVLRTNRRGLDTELQVWNEAEGEDRPEWRAWRDIKDTFKPNCVAEWISDFAVRASAEWLEDGGIVWVDQVEFGKRLAQATGLFYHGAGDSTILTTAAPGIIASMHAHGEGKNLERYSRALVTSPMTSGKHWEQLVGRIHRHGQKADEVVVDVNLLTPELEVSFEQARADARFLEDTLGQRQKLNYADVII